MEIIIMCILFFIVLTIAMVAFINNRVEPNKKKIEDLEKRMAQLENEVKK